MRNLKLFLFLIILAAGILITPAHGQDGPPPPDGNDERPNAGRFNLLAELGLSREQIQQIRRLNQARRQETMEAQRRLHEATRSLDMAIYADAPPSDAEFQARLKEFHAAQADVARLRFESELAVRKVLTQEQLVRFRELRRQFAERRKDNERRRRDRAIPPMQEGPFRRPVND